MSQRVRIKIGAIELEYESDKPIEKADVLEMLNAVSELAPKTRTNAGPKEEEEGAGDLASMTTSDFAQKLSATTGPGLVIAAAASLTFADGKAKFTRKELTDSMKSATHYWKETYQNNLSDSLKTLVRNGELTQSGTKEYALSATKREELMK
jgi:hypothetical protein